MANNQSNNNNHNNNNQTKTEWNFAEELARVREELIAEAKEQGIAKEGGTRSASQPLHLRKIYRKVGGKRLDTGRRAIKLSKTASKTDWGAYKGLQFKTEADAIKFIDKAYQVYNELVAKATA